MANAPETIVLQRPSSSFPSISAGFVAVLVGFTSSAVVVFKAAEAAGASPAQVSSWFLALCLGTAATSICLSLRYRTPVLTAWSTPGAALLATNLVGVSMSDAVGAFIFCGLLITLAGVSGWFERSMSRIPLSIASAMLAGVLLRFGLEAFLAAKSQTLLVVSMFIFYLVLKRFLPRYAVMGIAVAGTLGAIALGLLHFDALRFELAAPVFIRPTFSPIVMLGVGVPLFIVTMASQNIPGVAIMRASGYGTPVSPLITWTGIATLVLAPFGGFTLNLAAITAAICMGSEAHEDRTQRYKAAVAAGVFYLIVGLFGATIGSLFAAFPKELVSAIAGFALLVTIGNGLFVAMREEKEREPALVTFLVTASGVTLFGIGAAFWGLVAGGLAVVLSRK